MKIPAGKALTLIILTMVITHQATSADTLKTGRSRLFFENITELNLWMRSSNPAGITFFENFHAINLVEVNYTLDKKGIFYPAEPGLTNSFSALTKGYKKLGKLFFSGSFRYVNDHFNDLLYNNTLVFDRDNLYILGDTIGGKQQKEGFLLKGSAAMPLSKKLRFGIEADYQNYTGAKLKDPRNKNDISLLTITPGLIFSSNGFMAGISGGPVITNNDVSVSVTEDAKYSLMQFLGYGYYKPVLNIYSYSNTYYGSGFNTQLQAKIEKNTFTNFLTVSFNSLNEEVRYGSSNRLTDGISARKTLMVRDAQLIKKSKSLHQLDALFSMVRINGTEMMQHFETVIAGSYRYDTLITDKKATGKHITANYSGKLEYRFSRYNGEMESYRLRAGLAGDYMRSSHYPVETNGSQKVMNITPCAGFKKFLVFNKNILIPEIGAMYRTNIFRDKTYTITKWSEPEFQQLDYIARSSDFLEGSLKLQFIRVTRFRNLPQYYIDLNSSYTWFPEDLSVPANNFFLGTTLGLIF
ncbi:MAG TPA: hypothetical protein PKI12_06660 [Bacteroidales bacterium]|nr:hypothetical protein [Bacteroidales bacterium]